MAWQRRRGAEGVGAAGYGGKGRSTSAHHEPIERAPEPSRGGAERKAALLEYFAHPSPEVRAMGAAWEEALTLYGDEDSDAWVSALEDGTHPLCRVRMSQRSA